MRRLPLTVLTLLLAVMPLQAQSGTTVWSMRMKMPDSLQAKAGGLSEIDMRWTLGTDGDRLGFQMDFGEGMATAMPGIDLSSIRMQAVVHSGGDSASIGIILPPEIAAAMGGGIGMRLDVAIPDTLPGFPMPNLDSLMNAQQGDQPTVTNTGRTATVAGISCEEWEMTPKQSDSLPFSGKISMCLAESVPAMRAFTSLFERYMPSMGFDFSEMKEMGRKWFGGRELVAIRTVIGDNQDIVMQLESSTNKAPDASFFTLPDGLSPFPMEMIKGMAQGMQQDS